MKQPYISVIIPSYKPKDYLWQCLDSLYGQSMPKEQYEVILLLNDCNEPYATDIAHYADIRLRGMQFHLLQTDTGGVSNARNMAMDIAKGDFFTFIDDDDYVSPQYLEGLASVATEDTVSLSVIKSFIDGTDNFTDYYSKNEHNRMLQGRKYSINAAKRQFSIVCAKLIHRDIIGGRKFNTHFKNSEDSLFAFVISDNIKYATTSQNSCVYYRRLRENSALTKRKSLKEIWSIFYNFNAAVITTYINNMGRYSFLFFLTRILASCHGLLDNIIMNYKAKKSV